MAEVLLARLDDITAAIAGAIATVTNTGSVGTGVFKQITGTNAEFYKLNSASARMSISLNGTDRVDFDVVEANLTLSNMGGRVTLSQLPTIGQNQLFGKSTAGSGDPQILTLGTSLVMASSQLMRAALTGDVTAAQDNNATTIANDAVTFAKMQNITGPAVVGKSAAGAGDPAEISAAADDRVLARLAGALSFAQLTVGMFPNDVVTYAKIQNVSASSRILGRNTAGAGDIEEITASQAMDFVGATQGNVLYRGAAAWAALATATSGFMLTTQGAGADPIWSKPRLWPIERKTSSSVASYDFVTGLTGNRTFLFLGWLRPATDQVDLYIRSDSSAGASFDSGASDYKYTTAGGNIAGTGNAGSNAAAQMVLNHGASGVQSIGSDADQYISFAILFQPVSGSTQQFFGYAAWERADDTGVCSTIFFGMRDSTTSANAVQFLFDTGNIAAGDVTVYEIANG